MISPMAWRGIRSAASVVVAATTLLAGCGRIAITSPEQLSTAVEEAAAAKVSAISRQPSTGVCPLGYPIELVAAAGIADRFPNTPDRRSILRIGSGVIVCRMYFLNNDANGATFIAAPDKAAIDSDIGDRRRPKFGAAIPMLRGTVRLAPMAYVANRGLGCDAMWTSSVSKLVIAVEDTWPRADCLTELPAAWGYIIRRLSTPG